jgi:hypothetical protein
MSNDIVESGGGGWDNFAKIVAEEGSRGVRLKMTRDGHWVAGPEEEGLDGAVLTMDCEGALAGGQKWVDGKLVESRLGLVANGAYPPSKESFPQDEAEYWACGYFVNLVDEEGREFSYSGTSAGGRSAVADVFRTFIRTRINPTVKLTSTSYRHEQYGKIHKPKFLSAAQGLLPRSNFDGDSVPF